MKKFKGILIILLLFVVIYCLQINFFTWFNIAGIMPNLFVILVMFIGLFAGNKLGVVFGLFFGIILDIVFGRMVGVTGIMLAIIGFLGEYFDKNFAKDSRGMMLSISIISTILFELAMYIIKYIQFRTEIEIKEFLIILLVECVFNILIITIIYPWMKKLGYHLEETFKGRKLLTRYF